MTWLDEEEKNLIKPITGERLPSLKLEQKKVTQITIDFSKPFEKWDGDYQGKKITKAIIPCTVTGDATRYNFWLNKKNPLFAQLIRSGREGKTTFKIIATGTQTDTRYNIVDE